MTAATPKFGLVLANRGVLFGSTTVEELLELSDQAEASGWHSVWVGDSLLARPRLDSLILLSAIAGRTRRIRLGVACMASTPLRHALLLAHQWISLDFLSHGRTIFAPCQGRPGPGARFEHEFDSMGIEPRTRMRRLEETIEIVRLTSSAEHVSYNGGFFRFDDVTILPRPIQQPIPIWVTANPNLESRRATETAYRRVARLGDGWMTIRRTPDDIRTSLELIRGYADQIGRPLPPTFEVGFYHNVNVHEDREAAISESQRFLDAYYGEEYARGFTERWVTVGGPADCAAAIRQLLDAGVTTVILRLTSFDQGRQLRRVTEEVLPLLS